MKKYEIMYIVKPDVESERLNNVIERLSKTITDFDSTILEHKEMGLKELAYEPTLQKRLLYLAVCRSN